MTTISNCPLNSKQRPKIPVVQELLFLCCDQSGSNSSGVGTGVMTPFVSPVVVVVRTKSKLKEEAKSGGPEGIGWIKIMRTTNTEELND